MQTFYEWLTSDIAADLVGTLFHTLWQGLIFSAGLALYLWRADTGKPQRRYLVSVLCLLAVVVGGMVTFSVLQYQRHTAEPEPAAAVDQNMSPGANQPIVIAVPYQQPWTFRLMLVWLAGAVVMSLRIFRSLVSVSRLRAESFEVLSPDIRRWFEEARADLKVRARVPLRYCKGIHIPGVVGCLRPMVLLPVSMMTGVDEETLRIVFAHELAHIRRHDYVVNFLQMLIESVLFFNPCVWWISGRIREEREACCDAAGVRVTGKKLEYARVLLGWLEKQRPPAAAGPKVALLFTQPGSRQTLRRIRRIVQPQCPTEMPMTWSRLGVMTAVSLLAFFGLSQTAQFAVAFAGEMLSPEERIAVMELIEEEYGQAAYDENWYDMPKEERATVKGTIQSWDGGPLPDRILFYVSQSNGIRSSCKSSGIFSSCSGTPRPTPSQVEFEEKALNGTFSMGVVAEGYAPVLYGPIRLKKQQVVEGVNLTLPEGFPADLFVIDEEDGTAIAGAKITGGHAFSGVGYQHTIKLETDAEGWVQIAHAGEFPVSLNVTAEGYQDATFEKLPLTPNEPALLELKKGLPVTGIVVSEATGEPVAGAEIRPVLTKRPDTNYFGGQTSNPIAVTGADGRFEILSLRGDSQYILSVKAAEYGYYFTDSVTAGDTELVFPLSEPPVIHGTVLGDPNRLTVRKDQRVVPYTCYFVHGNSSDCGSVQYAEVTVGEDGIARFVLDDLWGHQVALGKNNWHNQQSIEKAQREGIVYDLRSSEERFEGDVAARTVQLVFEVPEGLPPVRGTVTFNPYDPVRQAYYYEDRQQLDVIDGVAETEMIVPGKFNLSMENVPGYWFKPFDNQEVEAGEGAYVHTIKAVPAGTIFGAVFGSDGLPVDRASVHFRILDPSPLLEGEDFNFVNSGVERRSISEAAEASTYTLSPLPLGGRYAVIARRDHTYVASEPIRLDEARPIRQVDLRLPEGVAFEVRVLGPEGGAMEGVPCELDFRSEKYGSFGTSPKYTDASGRAVFEHVNPDIDGTYTFRTDSRRGVRNARIKAVDVTEELIVQLEPGAVASGYVIDEATGWPIPGAAVQANYSDYKNDEYEYLKAEAPTDRNGFFRLSNLQAGRVYKLMVESCTDKDRHLYAGEVTGGQSEPVELRVVPHDHSGLAPRRPD